MKVRVNIQKLERESDILPRGQCHRSRNGHNKAAQKGGCGGGGCGGPVERQMKKRTFFFFISLIWI